MKLIEQNGLRHLIADNNKYIANKEMTMYCKELYLGKFDRQDNYIDINESQKNAIDKKLEEERLAREQEYERNVE